MSLSEQHFQAACAVIPGGVNSPVRAFRGVGGTPIFFEKAHGSRLWDVDGREYIDYVGSWGPAILGHADPDVIHAVTTTAANGLSFGAPSPLETELAKRVIELMPQLEQVRFVSSGTEATMSAIRLARGFTGRETIIKFEGCYHGHSDSLLMKAGSGLLTLGVPTSPGVPKALAATTLTLPFNDIDAIRTVFASSGHLIAAVIVEPIAGNMNFVAPIAGFLETLRSLCTDHGAVLIMDEVMTGFRVALGGAQSLYGVNGDLTTLGKVIGGGMPVGAFGGRADILKHLSPLGPVYQAGTLSGNPVAMAAGLATLKKISEPGFHQRLLQKTQALLQGLSERAKHHQVPFLTQGVAGMFGFYFTDQPSISSFAQATHCDVERFKTFFHAMLKEGVYLAPSAFEAGFISIAHSDRDIEFTLNAADRAFAACR